MQSCGAVHCGAISCAHAMKVSDYTGIPQAIVEKDYSDEISENHEQLDRRDRNRWGKFEDTEGYAFPNRAIFCSML